MVKKLAVLALAIAIASAGMTRVIKFSDPDGDENCFECIRAQFKFCAEPTEIYSNVVEPTNMCVAADIDCPEGKETIYNNINREVAAMRCP